MGSSSLKLSIVKTPNPVLRQKCRENFILPLGFIEAMLKLMLKSNGVGLAAPQVGFPYRMFVTAWGEAFINPVITARTGNIIKDDEGCLSIPGIFVTVPRHERIVLNNDWPFEGFQARIIQHEMDHLDGKLITDYK